MTQSPTPHSPTPPTKGLFARTRAYFGFAEPGLTWRRRLGIFYANEQRAFARLLGSRRPEDACDRNSMPPSG